MTFQKTMQLLLLLITANMIDAQTIIPLYKGSIPNSKPCSKVEDNSVAGRVSRITNPCIYAFIPEKKIAQKLVLLFAQVVVIHD